jgi:hypothetical protein
MKALLLWILGIAALAASYRLFDLPGLLIGLFVGGVTVATRRLKASQQQKGSLAILEVDGVRIDFAAMTMKEGAEEYALRRSVDGKWERRAISTDAISIALARRMGRFTSEEELVFLKKAEDMTSEVCGGNLSIPLPTKELAKIMTSLPPGSAARRSARETIESHGRRGVESAAFLAISSTSFSSCIETKNSCKP